MGEMNAFEQQLANVSRQVAGPVRSVDVMAAACSVKAATEGRWSILMRRFGGGLPAPTGGGFSVFSAVKLIGAGVIVVLFGGSLLGGVLSPEPWDEVVPAAVTDSPSPESEQVTPSLAPMTPDEMLSDFVTEEVAPGILRVANDGVRNLASAENRDIVVGHDGGVWLLRGSGFFRLGGSLSDWRNTDRGPRSEGYSSPFVVAPDGTVWADVWVKRDGKEVRLLGSHDGRRWTVHEPAESRRSDYGVDVAPDGTVWTDWRMVGDTMGTDIQLTALTPDGFQRVESPPSNMWRLTDGGALISWEWSLDGDYGVDVKRYVDGTWQEWRSARLESAPVGLATDLGGSEVYAGADGTVWAFLYDQAGPDVYLMRLDDEGKREWGPADGTPPTGLVTVAVAPDASVWGVHPADTCDGVSRFDGETWDRYLGGLCVQRMDFADDGSVWLLAGTEWSGVKTSPDGVTSDSPAMTHVYVITPEAVAAGE